MTGRSERWGGESEHELSEDKPKQHGTNEREREGKASSQPDDEFFGRRGLGKHTLGFTIITLGREGMMSHARRDRAGLDQTEALDPAHAFGEVCLGIFDSSESLVEFLVHLATVPFFRLEAFQNIKMPPKVIMGQTQLFDTLLSIVKVALHAAR